MSENLKLWNAVSHTDPKFTKTFNNGTYSGTAIDPQWQAMKATEAFGMFGVGWGLREEVYRLEKLDDKTTLMLYTGVLWYQYDGKTGEFPVTSSVRIMYQAKSERMIYDDEASKKVQTNAISKGLSRLGFSADVFLGQFDDSKYVQLAKEIADNERPISEVERKHLEQLFEKAGQDLSKFLEHYKVDSLYEFPELKYHEAVGMLSTKIRKKAEEAEKAKAAAKTKQ